MNEEWEWISKWKSERVEFEKEINKFCCKN